MSQDIIHQTDEHDDVDKWNPRLTEAIVALSRPLARYFRSEVTGLENIPSGPSLVVSNHSGGVLTPDMTVFAVAFYDNYGYDRPLYALGHDILFKEPIAELFRQTGVIRATRENAAKALASGAVVLVFPGGDYDAYRPSAAENVINFHGRTGYVTTAIEAGVPIVPTVSIGAQESQLFLTRGTRLSHALGLSKLTMKLLRTDTLPITFGFPFGVSILTMPINLPLPTKIVTEVLKPIDIKAEFGGHPDVDKVDRRVRSVMQTVLNRMARRRRFPILG
ncbi:MAG: lysophospholipid acyltransferase family protein [Mycobacterium sp.]